MLYLSSFQCYFFTWIIRLLLLYPVRCKIWANRLLDRIGLKLAYKSRTKAIKYYKLDEELATDPDRKAVFEALNLKWKNEVAKMAETDAQQSTQRVTDENNFLYKNNARSPNNKPKESTQNCVVDHTTEEWSKPEIIEDVSALLSDCESLEMLADLRKCDIPPDTFKQASRCLQAEKRQQIKEWVLELNAAV